jgi:hypothetical protein
MHYVHISFGYYILKDCVHAIVIVEMNEIFYGIGPKGNFPMNFHAKYTIGKVSMYLNPTNQYPL